MYQYQLADKYTNPLINLNLFSPLYPDDLQTRILKYLFKSIFLLPAESNNNCQRSAEDWKYCPLLLYRYQQALVAAVYFHG